MSLLYNDRVCRNRMYLENTPQYRLWVSTWRVTELMKIKHSSKPTHAHSWLSNKRTLYSAQPHACPPSPSGPSPAPEETFARLAKTIHDVISGRNSAYGSITLVSFRVESVCFVLRSHEFRMLLYFTTQICEIATYYEVWDSFTESNSDEFTQ